jgi:hypothetical protein
MTPVQKTNSILVVIETELPSLSTILKWLVLGCSKVLPLEKSVKRKGLPADVLPISLIILIFLERFGEITFTDQGTKR